MNVFLIIDQTRFVEKDDCSILVPKRDLSEILQSLERADAMRFAGVFVNLTEWDSVNEDGDFTSGKEEEACEALCTALDLRKLSLFVFCSESRDVQRLNAWFNMHLSRVPRAQNLGYVDGSLVGADLKTFCQPQGERVSA